MSWRISLKSVAGVDVANRQREEDKADGDHDDVHHGSAPSVKFLQRAGRRLLAARNLDLNQVRANESAGYGQLPVTAGIGMRDGGAKNVIGILYRSPVVAVAGRLQG